MAVTVNRKEKKKFGKEVGNVACQQHYNTIQLYCQVTNTQGMCYGTKHTHTHTHISHQKQTNKNKTTTTVNSKNIKIVQRVDLMRIKKGKTSILLV